MALRWCVLLGLLAFACAQQMNFTDAEDLEESIAERYVTDDADARRREHLYCLGYYDEVAEGPASGPDFADYPVNATDVWSIYMQFPVLSYLDVNRKGALYRVILRLAGFDPPNAIVANDLCQGALDFYAVTEYAESVLVRMYFRNNIGSTITQLNNQFRGSLATRPALYTLPFRGRIALNVLADSTFNAAYIDGLPPGSNLHPGSTLPNDRDPTFLAVVLGSWARNVTIDEAEEDLNIQPRASNPNPINYGLEAGDIVFSVIGSVLLAGIMGLVILGFCIHPFFLA